MKNGFQFGMSIATEPLSPSAPVIYRDDIHTVIRRARELGYDGIELQLRNPEKVDAGEIQAACQKEGIRICAIATGLEYSLNGLSMIDGDLARREEMRRRLFRDVELAEVFGCPVIVGCVRGNIPPDGDREESLARFREEMLLVSAKAQKHGVVIVLEAINFYVNNYLCSIRSACDFIDSLGRDNVKLHMDTHHMAIEEHDFLGAVRYAGERIGYVHFAENNRMYPGAGTVDFLGVMRILREQNYTGFITLEVVPLPDADRCAERGLAYLTRLAELVEFQPIDRA